MNYAALGIGLWSVGALATWISPSWFKRIRTWKHSWSWYFDSAVERHNNMELWHASTEPAHLPIIFACVRLTLAIFWPAWVMRYWLYGRPYVRLRWLRWRMRK